MKPSPFLYRVPRSVEEAVDLLAEHGDEAKLLAGGQSLVPTMNFRLARPAVLLDLNRIPELAYVEDGGNGLRIGAMTRQAKLEHDAGVAARSPLLAAAMPHVAHLQIRNRGTIGGSIAHADPAAEIPAVALATGARMKLRSRDGERWVAAEDFFHGFFFTAVEPADLLVEVEVPPLPAGTGWSFREIARRHGDFALVGVIATITIGKGRCEAARIVLFAVGGTPIVAAAAEACLRSGRLDAECFAEVARVAAFEDIDPVDDIHASADYRRRLTEVLVRRALSEAHGRARGAGNQA